MRINFWGLFPFVKKWDAMSKGNPFQEIARISYGHHLGNHISLIQVILISHFLLH